MTKQTDRLTRVEEIVKNSDRTLTALFSKFDDFVNDTQKVRIDCAGKQGTTKAHTTIQWYFIGAIILSIIVGKVTKFL